MKIRIPILAASIALAVLMPFSVARADGANEDSIRELLTASGAEESIRATLGTAMPALKQMFRNLPEDKLRQLMDSDRMVASLVVVYRKHFTEAEIQDMLTFYRTPAGAKLAALGARIGAEAADHHIQSWRMSLMNEQIQKGRFEIRQVEPGR